MSFWIVRSDASVRNVAWPLSGFQAIGFGMRSFCSVVLGVGVVNGLEIAHQHGDLFDFRAVLEFLVFPAGGVGERVLLAAPVGIVELEILLMNVRFQLVCVSNSRTRAWAC